MKNETAVIWMVAIFAILVWAVLKDRDEVFLTLAVPGVGTVAAGGRNRYSQRLVPANNFDEIN